MNLLTYEESDGKRLSKSPINLFKFSDEMRENCVDETLNKLLIDMDAKKVSNIKVKFSSGLACQGDSAVISGAVHMSASGYSQRYSVSLVGFVGEARLELDDCKLLEPSSSQEDAKLEKQLISRGLRQTLLSTQLTRTTNPLSYHKTILMRNRSSNTRCLVFPVILDTRKGIEIPSRINNDEIIADLNDESKIKLTLKSLYHSDDLAWVDMSPGEERSLRVDVDIKRCEAKLDSWAIGLFWLESEIHSYCCQGAQSCPSNEPLTKNLIFIDSFLNKLIGEPTMSASILYADQSFNASLFTSKAKVCREDFLRLARLSTRCFILNPQLTKSHQVIEIEDSFDFAINNSTNRFNFSLDQDEPRQDIESWSLSPETIVLQNLTSTSLPTSKIILKNNLLNRSLPFEVTFRRAGVDVEPSSGLLEPSRSIELKITPRKDILAKLPWLSVINITCNKSQKDVRLAFYPPLDNSSMPAPKPPIAKGQSMAKSNSSNSLPSISSLSTESTLEHGEITQINESLILTPLISASLLLPSASSSFKLDKSTAEQSAIKIASFGNNAQIQFPSVCVTQTKAYSLTLMNPTENGVTWKAYSTNPAVIRTNKKSESNSLESSMMKSNYSVFIFTPHSGIIPPGQKQTIKVEFNPREAFGIFSQPWEIDTRTDLQDLSAPHSSYSRKLVLSGRSVPWDSYENANEEEDYHLRLSSRILKPKTNSVLNEPDQSQSLKYMKTESKENSMMAKSNNSTGFSAQMFSQKKILIKEEILTFPDTAPGKTSKSYLTIHNREEKASDLNIFRIMEPFHCKYAGTTVNVNSKHYIKVPVEFKPRVAGEYFDKIIIRANNSETLTCTLKARCVHTT